MILNMAALALTTVASSPSPYLNPLLQFTNGSMVTTSEQWESRRAEVSALVQSTFLGTMPTGPPPELVSHTIINTTVAGDGVLCTFIELTFDTSAGGTLKTVSMPIEILSTVDHPGAPTILRPVFMTQWNHRQWSVYAVSRGYIGVVYPASDAKDAAPLFQKAFPKATFALIAARAYVASRCLDFLMKCWPGVDGAKVAVSGHSRNGKQSLVFAAFDTRVTAVVGSSPGAPIAAPYHFTSSNFYGEGPRTGGVTCVGAKWWLCSSLQYAGHPELMPMDGHGIVGMIAPRACAIATGRQDQASDMVFAGEQNIKESAKVYALLDASQYPLNIYRPGQHHGFDDITTYFDFFDHAFDRLSSYGQAMERTGVQTHASLLRWYRTYLTAAGFDWDVFNSTSTFNRTPPNRSTPIAHRIKWLLALGSDVGGELGTFSMGATYGEESEGSSYIPPMMGHTVSSGLSQQAFSFGDYLNGEIYWRNVANQNDSPRPAVIWLHPYSYNTGYSPSYGQAKMHEMLAQAGFVTMAFDQIGFGLRNNQGGNRFYGQHGGNASLFGHMVKDTMAAVDFLTCRSAFRNNASMCSQHGYAVSNAGIDRIPIVDLSKIYVVGYSLGGNVALHTAALDSRIAAVASFAGFTPFRNDTNDRSTGGIKRLYDLHALIPKLGLFAENPDEIPYDYDDVLGEIAPRPTLIYSPTEDRDATHADVTACVNDARKAWGAKGELLVQLSPDSVTKMELIEANAAVAWLKTLSTM